MRCCYGVKYSVNGRYSAERAVGVSSNCGEYLSKKQTECWLCRDPRLRYLTRPVPWRSLLPFASTRSFHSRGGRPRQRQVGGAHFTLSRPNIWSGRILSRSSPTLHCHPISTQTSRPRYSFHRTPSSAWGHSPAITRGRGFARRSYTSPHAATMPLAERDVNTQHQRPLARGKRLPAAGYVTDENATPSPVVARMKETPTSPQRFFTPTKASTAKNTPPSATIQPRVHPHLNRDTPRSRIQGSKLPRRNAATPTAKPAYNPPISKWNLPVANAPGPEKTMNALQTSPSSPTPIEVTVNQSLVCAHHDRSFAVCSHVI